MRQFLVLVERAGFGYGCAIDVAAENPHDAAKFAVASSADARPVMETMSTLVLEVLPIPNGGIAPWYHIEVRRAMDTTSAPAERVRRNG